MTVGQDAEVMVVGGGLAGLIAAERLCGAGVDVRVLEAGRRVGGRVRGEPGGQCVFDTGAEFVGDPHWRLRALVTALGLRTGPARLDRGPVRWRLPDRHRTSRLPPVPVSELMRLGRAWSRLRHQALTLHPDQPWTTPAATGLDTVSLADWLTAHGVRRGGLAVTEALIGGFATRPIDQLSAAHAAWWIAAAGGVLAALRSGRQYVVVGGAHQVPHLLAQRLGGRVHVDSPVVAVREHPDGVEVDTGERVWRASAVILALPLPALRRLCVEPPPPARFTTAVHALGYGHATKIAATAIIAPPVQHRTVVGGSPLAIAWRHGGTLSGIVTADANRGTSKEVLAADLATVFGLDPGQITDPTMTDWTNDLHIGGSYLVYAPGQLTRHRPALNIHRRRVVFAGADFSGWPNSMEGAIQSGQTAAHALMDRRIVDR